MMKTLYRSRAGRYRTFSRSSRISLMPRFEAASISITSTRVARGDFRQLAHTPHGCRGGSLYAIQATRQNAGDRRFSGAALSREDVAMRNAPASNRVFERRSDVLLADQIFGKRLRAVLPAR